MVKIFFDFFQPSVRFGHPKTENLLQEKVFSNPDYSNTCVKISGIQIFTKIFGKVVHF
jgi:hypothetical protein